jgi:hypothetical protein
VQKHTGAIELIINKNFFLVGQMGNAGETPFFFDMPTNTTVGTKGSKLLLLKISGHGELRITVMVLILAGMRNLIPFVVLKRKNLLTDKLPGGIGRMAERYVVQKTRCSSKEHRSAAM